MSLLFSPVAWILVLITVPVTVPLRWFRSRSHRARCRLSVLVFPVLSLGLFVGTVRQPDAEDCPLVFDLSGNGRIDITGHVSTRDKLYTLMSLFDSGSPAFAEFDIFANGRPALIDWIVADTDAFPVDRFITDPVGFFRRTFL